MTDAPRRLKVAITGAGLTRSPDGREGWAVRTRSWPSIDYSGIS